MHCNSAGDGTASRDGQKQQLLNDIAQTIREEVLPSDAEEVEQELVVQLPHLFQDPHMRETHFLRDNTVTAEIVDHIFAPSNAKDRPDKPRSFAEADLPLGGSDFIHASKQARDAIQVIELDPAAYRPLAVEIINRNLGPAIARTLSFSGDRVEQLMARLRTHLKRQGKELVLLVEEFARLQGIDRALLQAITSHGDDRQCRMRSAIAVTTGFFESVAETAYMRTTHIVDMDRSAGRTGGQNITSETLSEFAALYLNAVRLGRARIDAWHETAGPGDKPPSKCADCPYQAECHETFGAVDLYGLYPFTRRAMWNSASRAVRSMPESLNPRILQNDLLVEVLDNFASTIQTGQFPPFRLLTKLGGPKALSLAAQTGLQNRNPQTAERWMAFLELYDGTGVIKNLAAPLRSAFEVPEIPGADDGKVDAPATAPVTGPVSTPKAPTASREDLAIETWINGSGLEQTVATSLRPLIFAAVADAIDWDMLGLAKSFFVGNTTGRAFQRNSVSFDRQTTQVQQHLQVKLRIPGDLVKPAAAGTALQGLLRASKHQFRWDFDDGDKMLAAFLDCIEVWARSVEEQLRALCAPSPQWSQSAAALELLCTGAAIGGRIKPDANIARMIDAAFANNWPSECASTAREMRAVYATLVKNRDKLVDLARAQISSMKGGRAGSMLNPRRYLRTIRDLRRSKWKLNLEPPEEERRDLANLYLEIKAQLASAAAAEWTLRREWLTEMEASFGTDATRATIVAALDEARQAAFDAGISSQNSSRPLLNALEVFKSVQFDDSLAAARALASQDDPLAALPHLGRGRRNAVDAGTELTNVATLFLDTVDQNLTAFSQDHNAKHDTIATSLDRIDTALQAIEADLTALLAAVAETADAD